MRRTTYALILLGAVAALVIAGCGGGGGSSTSNSSESKAAETGEQSSSSSSSGEGAEVAGAEVSGLGSVLVSAEGLTLYMFGKDSGSSSSCYGSCAEAWPPLLTEGEPTAGEGASSSQLGTTKRKDGTEQVTYAGHPLYMFFEDKSAGEANGNGSEAFGGIWMALDESGSPVEGSATGEEEESGTGGYSGY